MEVSRDLVGLMTDPSPTCALLHLLLFFTVKADGLTFIHPSVHSLSARNCSPLPCSRECKVGQPWWESVQQFLQKVKRRTQMRCRGNLTLVYVSQW